MIARGPASSRSGMPRPPRVVVEALEGVLPVAGWPEAHVTLPGQRLDERARAVVEDGLQVPVGPVPRQRLAQLGDRQRAVRAVRRGRRPGSRASPPRAAGSAPPSWAAPTAGPLTGARGRRHPPRARGSASTPRNANALITSPSASACASSPGRDVRTPGAHRQLGQRLVHRQDRTEPAYDVGGRVGPDRIEEVPLHPPAERFGPRHRDLGAGSHQCSIPPLRRKAARVTRVRRRPHS